MNSIRTHIHTFAYQEKNRFIIKKLKAQTSVVFKNIRGVTLCLHTHQLIVNRFQAIRRPTGFTMDYYYVALDVCVVPRCRGGGGDVYVCVCVLGGGGKSRRILASISMGGPNLKTECDMYEIIMGGEFDPGPVPYFRGD